MPNIVKTGYLKISEVTELDDFIDKEITSQSVVEISTDGSRYYRKEGTHKILILPSSDGAFTKVKFCNLTKWGKL